MAIIEIGLSVYLNTRESVKIYGDYDKYQVKCEVIDREFLISDYYKITNLEHLHSKFMQLALNNVLVKYFTDEKIDMDSDILWWQKKPYQFLHKYFRIYHVPKYIQKNERPAVVVKYANENRLYERKVFFTDQHYIIDFIKDYCDKEHGLHQKSIDKFIKTGKLEDLMFDNENFCLINHKNI